MQKAAEDRGRIRSRKNFRNYEEIQGASGIGNYTAGVLCLWNSKTAVDGKIVSPVVSRPYERCDIMKVRQDKDRK